MIFIGQFTLLQVRKRWWFHKKLEKWALFLHFMYVNITDWIFSLKSFHFEKSFSYIINKTVNLIQFLKSLKMFQNAIAKAVLHKKLSEGLFSLMFSLSLLALFNQNYGIWLELWSIVKILINILKSVKSSSVFCTCVICQALGQGVRLHPQLLGREVQEFVFSDKTVEDSQVV